MTNPLDTLSAAFLPAIDAEMRTVLGADEPSRAANPFYGMIHYHMGWANDQLRPIESNGGKRIRPILCLLACVASGGDWEQAVPAAAAIEILHNFSLVHDDIQDNSPTRRGRPTLWTLWGQPQAINTGDAMFAMAHLALSRLAEEGVPPAVVVRALRRFDETCIALTQGQYTDMSFETRDAVDVEEYIAMITGKTAALIGLAAELGPLVARADDQRIRAFADYGLNMGLAFQVQDDILGIWGDEDLTGKSAATDITTRKKTLPVLYALSKSPQLRELYDGEVTGQEFVRRVVPILDETGARRFADDAAERYTNMAIAGLSAAQPVEPGAGALRDLTATLLRRDF
ncbi:MAG: polyprenyl synthetase family protein [Candidatus Promineofilum sp.]|nr:polyprenyl synthetase family protein [Promineifilum sp.]